MCIRDRYRSADLGEAVTLAVNHIKDLRVWRPLLFAETTDTIPSAPSSGRYLSPVPPEVHSAAQPVPEKDDVARQGKSTAACVIEATLVFVNSQDKCCTLFQQLLNYGEPDAPRRHAAGVLIP